MNKPLDTILIDIRMQNEIVKMKQNSANPTAGIGLEGILHFHGRD